MMKNSPQIPGSIISPKRSKGHKVCLKHVGTSNQASIKEGIHIRSSPYTQLLILPGGASHHQSHKAPRMSWNMGSFWNVRVPNSIQRRCCVPISSQVFHHVLPTSNGQSIHINMTLRAHLVIQNHIEFRVTSPWRFWPFGCPGHGLKSARCQKFREPLLFISQFTIQRSSSLSQKMFNITNL